MRDERHVRQTCFGSLAGALSIVCLLLLGTCDPARAGTESTLDVPIAVSQSVCPGYETSLFCGELTGDCIVSASDALSALRMAVGALASMPEADIDFSGSVTASDALEILRIAVGADPPTTSCDRTTVTLSAIASGFYSQTGAHEPDNYAVGWYGTPNDDELRDYFVFDLPASGKTVVGAKLRLRTAPDGYIIYGSDDPSETYTLFEVATDTAALSDGSAGVSAFDDLADGAVYGTLVATSALGTTVEIELNDAALTMLNASTGNVAIGGAITTLAKGANNEFLFNSTSAALTRELVVILE